MKPFFETFLKPFLKSSSFPFSGKVAQESTANRNSAEAQERALVASLSRPDGIMEKDILTSLRKFVQLMGTYLKRHTYEYTSQVK